MSGPLNSSASALRWNTTVEWTSEERTEKTSSLVFHRDSVAILKLDVSNDVITFLSNYMPDLQQIVSTSASNSDPAKAVGNFEENPQVAAFLALLRKHRILVPAENDSKGATVTLYADPQTVIETWHLESERPIAIDILVGDEARLNKHYEIFASGRTAGHLVSFIKIYTDMIEVGPVRFPYEKAAPTTRTSNPLHYSAWPQRLQQARGLLKDFFLDAVTSTKWHSLTTRGSRMAFTWEEAKAPYRVVATPMSQLTECVPFFHWRAQVEGESGAGGVGSSIVTAEYSATCEAWERYCLARPDLAVSADHLTGGDIRSVPGVYFDYLRKLSKPIKRAPAFTEGWSLTDHRPLKVPTEWMHFNGHNSVSNSSGAAFGSSTLDAVFGAKIEVVERHLLMQTYLQISKAREFVPEDGVIDTNIKEFLRTRGRRARFYDLGVCNDISGVVCVIGSDLPPYASIGCSGKSSRDDAVTKALYEAIVTDSQWSRRIEQYGPKRFVEMGKGYLQANPNSVGFEESAWHWAAMEDAEERLHRRFHTGEPMVGALAEDSFVAVDIGKNIVQRGVVVKVIHPDALPLPSCFAHARALFDLLNLSETLTIPMY